MDGWMDGWPNAWALLTGKPTGCSHLPGKGLATFQSNPSQILVGIDGIGAYPHISDIIEVKPPNSQAA